jgi:putative acyl-CoA dehydrogenase
MDETLSRRPSPRRDAEGSPSRAAAPDFSGDNAFAADPVLGACLEAGLDEATEEELGEAGAYWGSVEAHEVARIAVEHGPGFRRFDHEGRRVDQVEMHPAYHALLNRGVTAGVLSSAWEEGGEEHNQHRLRAARLFLTAGCERGHLLPVSATHAAVAALAHAPDLEAELFPLIASRRYDRRPVPLAEKEGALVTFALSERPSAESLRGDLSGSDRVTVSGERWLVAAPGADMILVLAETAQGPAAVMVPRHAPENTGAVTIETLVAPVGLGAQAFAAVAFDGATGRLVGEPGRGTQVLRDARTLTQLDSAVIAAGALRNGVARAAHHARYAVAGGRAPIADPLQARVLADLALESAAITALVIRVAHAFDTAFEREGDHAIARIVTPAARIHALKAAASFAAEVTAALGSTAAGAGHPAARIGPDLIALAEWQGRATDAAADLAVTVARDGNVLADALDELGADIGQQNLDILEDVQRLGERAAGDPAVAFVFAEQLAMAAAAAAMRRNLPRVVADAYVTSRLRDRYRTGYGALDGRFDAAAIIDFILPEA